MLLEEERRGKNDNNVGSMILKVAASKDYCSTCNKSHKKKLCEKKHSEKVSEWLRRK